VQHFAQGAEIPKPAYDKFFSMQASCNGEKVRHVPLLINRYVLVVAGCCFVPILDETKRGVGVCLSTLAPVVASELRPPS
jgi:hypothetical protein